MEYSLLGNSGMRVSKLVLGTALFGVAPLERDADEVIGTALDLGINAIDTANAYGNLAHFDRDGVPPAAERRSAEEIIGSVLGARRDDVVLSTKASEPVGPGPNDRGLSRRHLTEQLERSLRRLRTDHVDLFYAHHPDPDTPLEQTIATLDNLVRSGKTRSWALSTYPAWQTAQAMWIADKRNATPPACLQVRYSLVARQVETEIVPAAEEFGLSLIVFSPLAGGLLAGEAARGREWSGEKRWGGGGFTPSQLAAAEALDSLAAEWGFTSAQLALAWVLRRPTVAAAIVGPESASELAASSAAVDLAADLDASQLARLGEIGRSGIVEAEGRPAQPITPA
jgi:aryl-alcohol dehydrogenase-like predicted oxidoreductase